MARQDIDPLGNEEKSRKWQRNKQLSTSDMLKNGCKVHQTLAYISCVPVLQGDTMELQRGLPFAAISAEKSPLLACIKGRVAAKNDDHFATVWVRRTARQTGTQTHMEDRQDTANKQAAEDLGDCFYFI